MKGDIYTIGPLTKEGETPSSINNENTTITPDGFIQSLKLSQVHKSVSDFLLMSY